jgi:hypothetical protein
VYSATPFAEGFAPWMLTHLAFGPSPSGQALYYTTYSGPGEVRRIVSTASPPTGYPGAVLADSPAGYWRLEETSGTLAGDASGGGNPGLYEGGPTLGLTGLIGEGRSAAFDGSGQRVLVPSSPLLGPAAALSVEAWLRAASLPPAGAYRTIVLKGGSYWLRLEGTPAGARPHFLVRSGGSWVGLAAPGTIAAGSTHHLVASHDGTTLRLYLDGVQVASRAHTGALDVSSNPLQLSGASGFGWHGGLDELAVYALALPAARVAAHYSEGTPEAAAVSSTSAAHAAGPVSRPSRFRTGSPTGRAAA